MTKFVEERIFSRLNFDERREILLSVKYVSEVIPSKWLIDDRFIIENKIDILAHGNDNSNEVSECEVVIFQGHWVFRHAT